MKPLRVLAVDDEALALRRVEMALSQIPYAELVGSARGGREGLQLVRDLRPDVLLLDIMMPGFGGFSLVEGLDKDNAPLVIFVTAYNEHAVRAFQVNAVDYLLKPLEFDRFSQSLEKARTTLRLMDSEERAAELRQLLDLLREDRARLDGPRFETELWVPRGGGFERVNVGDINWVEAERDYIHLHSRSQSWLLRETMASMQARLDPALFTRVHRSALVRNERIVSVQRPGYGKYKLLLSTGEEVPVGSTYVKPLKQLLRARAEVA